jgi:hypothetical protein
MAVVVSLIVFGVVALLISCAMMRTADRFARCAPQPDGTAFDVSPLRPRIQTVRSDFAAQSSLRNTSSPYHEELIESARQAISKMAFFQSRSQDFRALLAESERH